MLPLPSGLSSAPFTQSPQGVFCEAPCFFLLRDDNDLQIALQKPLHTFIESTGPHYAKTCLMKAQEKHPDIFISLTTASAYRFLVAQDVCQMLGNRLLLSPALRLDVQTCLQEALVNAIVHGNLQVKSRFTSCKSFENYCQQTQQQLMEPMLGQRRIRIYIWHHRHLLTLQVQDEGKALLSLSDEYDAPCPHGRGLFLIRSLSDSYWIGEDYSSLYMRFLTDI
jgi:anti-sigma regulatory factor (Ser/Thr protein kinase)